MTSAEVIPTGLSTSKIPSTPDTLGLSPVVVPRATHSSSVFASVFVEGEIPYGWPDREPCHIGTVAAVCGVAGDELQFDVECIQRHS